jgi:hypothetical protein
MNLEQQTALESVVGRALTDDEKTAIAPHLAYDARNDVAIAGLLSVGRRRIESRPIRIAGILSHLSPNGGAMLDALEAAGAVDPNVKWFFRDLVANGIDVGQSETRLSLMRYKLMLPDFSEAIDMLLALAEVPDQVDYNRVSDALNVAEGRLTRNQL